VNLRAVRRNLSFATAKCLFFFLFLLFLCENQLICVNFFTVKFLRFK
jgi:hypothetical protein